MALQNTMSVDSTVRPQTRAHTGLQQGVDLHWPASAIWHPGEPKVYAIGLTDLKDALAKGIEDFKAIPSFAVFLVIIYPIAGLILFRLIFGYNVLPLIYPMLAGFTLLGPAAAIGLYELSRRRERGLETSASHIFDVFHSPSTGAIARLSLSLLAIFFAWLATAKMMFEQIVGTAVPTSIETFANQIVGTPAGHSLIIVGNSVGLLFAVLVLVVTFVSFPMLVDRPVSASTAVRTSIRAVLESPLTVAMWGLFVAAALLIGALPFFIGLAVVFPILGHATWHLYRRVVSPDEVI